MAVSGKGALVGILLLCSSLGYGILLGPVQISVRDLLPAVWLGIVPFAFYATKSVLSYAGGRLSDRIGRETVIMGGFLLAAAGLALGASWTSTVGLLFCSFAMALQNALAPTSATAVLADATSSERRHLALGAMFAWRDLGVAVGLLGSMGLQALAPANPRGTAMVTFYSFAGVFAICAALSGILARRVEEKI